MFLARINELSAIAEREFSGLNSNQLNWKTDDKQWSIGQCLHHLKITNELYMPALRKIADGTYIPNFWEKINPLTDYTGNQMIKTLGPNVIKTYKSPRLFTPGKNIHNNIVVDFLNHQDELGQLFNILETEDKLALKITSPVAALITLKVNDAMNIIIVHEDRHMLQGIRIKNSENFPA